MPSEFELIDRFFRDCGARRDDVTLGVGDDGAVLECRPDAQLVAVIDTLVEGVHFPPGSAPRSIGHRVLAVNLSDLAAMGAEPAWALLALTLPRVAPAGRAQDEKPGGRARDEAPAGRAQDEAPGALPRDEAPGGRARDEEPAGCARSWDDDWLAQFSAGLGDLAAAHGVALVGGDTTAGPLAATVQALGFVPRGAALTRSGGRPGDALFVSGTLGDAAAGLMLEQGRLGVADAEHDSWLRRRFLFPTPRVALGMRLRGIASSCIDVSDGLLGDAAKLAAAGACGAQIAWEQLPVSPALAATCGEEGARELALTGGEDYELCFTVPPARAAELERAVPPAVWGWRRIGVLTPSREVQVRRGGTVMQLSHRGFDHFG